jgi:hypothetical protein
MRSIGDVSAEAGKGLVGDRYHGSRCGIPNRPGTIWVGDLVDTAGS